MRSTGREATIATPNGTLMTTPSAKPSSTSCSVTHAFAPRASGCRATAATISDGVGRTYFGTWNRPAHCHSNSSAAYAASAGPYARHAATSRIPTVGRGAVTGRPADAVVTVERHAPPRPGAPAVGPETGGLRRGIALGIEKRLHDERHDPRPREHPHRRRRAGEGVLRHRARSGGRSPAAVQLTGLLALCRRYGRRAHQFFGTQRTDARGRCVARRRCARRRSGQRRPRGV